MPSLAMRKLARSPVTEHVFRMHCLRIFRRRRAFVLQEMLACVLAFAVASAESNAASGSPDSTHSKAFETRIRYGLEVFEAPRPLRLHWIRLDLQDRNFELVPVVAEDPDGDGPAEASLTMPADLLAGEPFVAAINASAFRVLPGTKLKDGGWHEGRPVTINGAVVGDGRVFSPMDGELEQFWIDGNRQPHFGVSLPEPDSVAFAVGSHAAKRGLILENGAVTVSDAAFSTDLHPRTAIGVDESGRWLWLVVVDGRQDGFSEGVSLAELATLMKHLGCDNALNLDGGGSSILLLAGKDGALRTMNDPSGGAARPVPIMLGVRAVKYEH